MRPRYPGWTRFQEQGLDVLHKGVSKNEDSGKIIDDLNELQHVPKV